MIGENEPKPVELSVLHELSRAVTGQLDTAQLVHAIHGEVGRVLDARNMVILLYDEGCREFEVALRMLDGKPDPNPIRRYSLGPGLMSAVVDRRQVIRTANYAESCRLEGLEPIPTSLNFPHWLGVPMVAGDRVFGVLALQDAARPFTEADEQLLTNIAGLAALAVRSARLYEEKARAYGELAAAQDHLLRAEKLLTLGEMAGGSLTTSTTCWPSSWRARAPLIEALRAPHPCLRHTRAQGARVPDPARGAGTLYH